MQSEGGATFGFVAQLKLNGMGGLKGTKDRRILARSVKNVQNQGLCRTL